MQDTIQTQPEDFSNKIQLACEKIRQMLEIKQASLGIETRIELAEKLQYYCDQGVTIDHNNLSGYLRKRKNGTYVFPTIEKLKAIGKFLGYNLSEFYEILFNEAEDKDLGDDFVTSAIQKISKLQADELITLHRLFSEEIYRKFR